MAAIVILTISLLISFFVLNLHLSVYPQSNLLTYENREKGFIVKYPANWAKIEANEPSTPCTERICELVSFWSPDMLSSTEYVFGSYNIVVEKNRFPGLTLDQIFNENINSIQRKGLDMNLTNPTHTTLAGLPAIKYNISAQHIH